MSKLKLFCAQHTHIKQHMIFKYMYIYVRIFNNSKLGIYQQDTVQLDYLTVLKSDCFYCTVQLQKYVLTIGSIVTFAHLSIYHM